MAFKVGDMVVAGDDQGDPPRIVRVLHINGDVVSVAGTAEAGSSAQEAPTDHPASALRPATTDEMKAAGRRSRIVQAAREIDYLLNEGQVDRAADLVRQTERGVACAALEECATLAQRTLAHVGTSSNGPLLARQAGAELPAEWSAERDTRLGELAELAGCER